MTIVYHVEQLPLWQDIKRCSKCGVEKPLSEFNKAKNQKSGYYSSCKECKKAPPPRREATSQVCKKCGIEYPLDSFHKLSRSPTGYRTICKDCQYELYAPQKRKNPQVTRRRYSKPFIPPTTKRCYVCHEEKVLEDFALDKYRPDGHKNRCKECDKAYRHSHREEIRTYHYTYHRRNRAMVLVQSKVRYLRRRQQVLDRCRQYNEVPANKEAKRRRGQKWRRANALRVNQYSMKHRALKRAAQVGKVDYRRILERDGFTCHICARGVTRDQLSFDHVIPLHRHGAHSEENIKVAHLICNLRKAAKLMCELTEWDRRGP